MTKNYLIIVFLIFVFSVFYFLLSRAKNSTDLYVRAIFAPKEDLTVAVPYWVANSLKKGDREKTAFGQTIAEITDIESYEGGGHGKHLIMEMKITAQRDRADNFSYKNQSLALNEWVDFNFGKVKQRGLITYLDAKPSKYPVKMLLVNLVKKKELTYIAGQVRIGDVMLNDKGEAMARVTALKISPSVFKDANLAEAVDDIARSVEITAKEINGILYFGEIAKIAVGQKITLFFKNVTLWEADITSVGSLTD